MKTYNDSSALAAAVLNFNQLRAVSVRNGAFRVSMSTCMTLMTCWPACPPAPPGPPLPFALTASHMALVWSDSRTNGSQITAYKLWRKRCVDLEEGQYHQGSVRGDASRVAVSS